MVKPKLCDDGGKPVCEEIPGLVRESTDEWQPKEPRGADESEVRKHKLTAEGPSSGEMRADKCAQRRVLRHGRC